MAQSGAFSGFNRWIFGLAGAGALTAGTIALFKTQNDTGTAAMLTIGTLLSAIGVIGRKIDSFEFGGAKIKLLAVETAERKLAQADEKQKDGDLDSAERLRGSAQAILDVAGVDASPFYARVPFDADENLILSKAGNYKGSGGLLELTNKHPRFINIGIGGIPNPILSLHDINSVQKGRNAGITHPPEIIVNTKTGAQIKIGTVAGVMSPNWSKENNTNRDQMLDAISREISQLS